MAEGSLRTRFVLPVVVICLGAAAPSTAAAQLGGGSSSASPDGSRPKSTQVSFLELLRSAGRWSVDKLESIGPQDMAADGPKWDSTESPQHAVMTFTTAMDDVRRGQTDAWPRALQTLGGEGLAKDRRQVALDLQDVFDRLPEITSGSLPSNEAVRSGDLSRYEVFPRGIDSEWAYKALEDGPDGAIVLERSDRGWTFNSATVDGAADLAESMRSIPPRSWSSEDGAVFEQTVVPTFTNSPWWAWLAAAGLLALGFVAAWAICKGIDWVTTKLTGHGDEIFSPLLRGLRTPLSVVALAAAFAAATAPLHLEPALEDLRWRIVEFLMIVAGVWLLVALLEIAVYLLRSLVVRDDNPYAKMATNVFQRTIRLLALAALTVYVFQHVLDWNVTALVGGIGLLGLALSLAAKDAVGNLFGAIMIFASRPFVIGDWIIFEGEIGQVDDVSLQMTKVRLLGGELLAIPNQRFVDRTVENLSMRKWKRRVMNVQITYDTPPERINEARELLQTVLRSDEVVGDNDCDLDQYPPEVHFSHFGPHFLNIRADYWYLMRDDQSDADSSQIQRDTERGYLSYLAHCGKVNERIFAAFTEAGIDFAFPTQTIELERAGESGKADDADGSAADGSAADGSAAGKSSPKGRRPASAAS